MKEKVSKNTAAEEVVTGMPYEEPSEEQLQREFQEILKKRKAYQQEVAEEVRAIQKEQFADKRRRMASLTKAAVIVLVAGSCLFAFSMRSEATRMWWLESVERIIGNDSGHVVDNDDKRIISESPEQQAVAEIETNAKIPMPKLQYKPTGFTFDSYDYDEGIGRGGLYYLYNDYVIMINAHTSDKNSAYAWNYDGEILSEQMVDTEYAEVKIMEFLAEGDNESSVAAEWMYHNHQYRIAGKLPFEELKVVVENIFY